MTAACGTTAAGVGRLDRDRDGHDPFFALVITAIVAAVRYLGGPDTSTDRPPTVHSQDADPMRSSPNASPAGTSTTRNTVAAWHCCGNTSERDHEPQPPAGPDY